MVCISLYFPYSKSVLSISSFLQLTLCNAVCFFRCKGRFVALSREKCIHLLIHLLPALERIYDIEKRAWRAMKLQLGASVHMPFWRKAVCDREICDQCATTIFNLHTMCFYCGFAQCPKCFLSGRPNGNFSCLMKVVDLVESSGSAAENAFS